MKKVNKKAKFNYKLLKSFEAGAVLNGAEVKAIRRGEVDLSNSYAKIVNNEVFLINTNIPVPGKLEYSPTRTRKLLLHKDEIISIKTEIKAKKLTLVPAKVYTRNNLVKFELALAKPKRQFQKKESIKKRDIERDLEKELKERESV